MYCHILRVRAIPTLESTDSMINFVSDDLSRAQKKCHTFTLQKGSLLQACMHFTTRGLTAGASTNRFKLLPVSCGCTDNFHVRDNHMHVVRSHVLAT